MSTPPPSSSGGGFGAGVATVGRGIAYLRAVVLTLVGIAGIVGGSILIIRSKKNSWQQASLTVTSSNCPTAAPPPSTSCTVSGTFTDAAGNTINVSNLSLSGSNAQVGTVVSIQYQAANPQVVRSIGLSAKQERTIGLIIIGIAAALMLISWLLAWAASKSTVVAQGTAALEGLSLLSRF